MVKNKNIKKIKNEKAHTTIRKEENLHIRIIFTLVLLCVFGCLMVFSASSYICSQKEMYYYNSMFMLKKQAGAMAAGFAIIAASLFMNVSWLTKKLAMPIYLAGYVCIFLLLSPLKVSSHGATRWIRIMGIQFQVAEVVKISVIIMLASMIKKYARYISKPGLTIRMWMAGGIPAILLFLISSDLSSSVVVLAITFGITFITNKTLKLHLGVLAAGIGGVAAYVLSIARNMPTPEELGKMSFRVGRIAAWIDPERYADDQGLQTLHSLYAIGSSGLLGCGIGNSVMKKGPIPEPQNDMIFAIIVEELGMFGAGTLIFLYMYLLYLLLRVIIKRNLIYESTIVLGVMLHIGVQAFFNISVTLNVLPNTGIGLPFISYGGTSILCLMAEMALVCSIAKKDYLKRIKTP